MDSLKAANVTPRAELSVCAGSCEHPTATARAWDADTLCKSVHAKENRLLLLPCLSSQISFYISLIFKLFFISNCPSCAVTGTSPVQGNQLWPWFILNYPMHREDLPLKSHSQAGICLLCLYQLLWKATLFKDNICSSPAWRIIRHISSCLALQFLHVA